MPLPTSQLQFTSMFLQNVITLLFYPIFVWNCHNWDMNCWGMAKNMFWEVTVTFDHKNRISSSLSSSGRLCQIWRNSLKAFLRQELDGREFTVTLTFDPWTPKSNQFMLGSRWTFAPNLKKITFRCSWDIAFTRMVQTDEWTTRKHKASGHRGMKMHHILSVDLFSKECSRIKSTIFSSEMWWIMSFKETWNRKTQVKYKYKFYLSSLPSSYFPPLLFSNGCVRTVTQLCQLCVFFGCLFR